MTRYSDLRDRAAAFVRESAPSGDVLVLAPTRGAADEISRLACGAALIGIHARAFREWVMELAEGELYRQELVPVGRIAREAIAARVTSDALAAGALTYFAGVARFPGFPRALTDTIEELRLNAVTPDQLRTCGQSGSDLAFLLEAYARELTDRRWADHAARVKLALPTLDAVARMSVVAIDLAPRTKLERELLSRAMDVARTHLDLKLAAVSGAGPLGGALWAQEPPGSSLPITEPTPQQRSTSLTSLQRYLFSADAVPVRDDDGTVEIFSTSGEALECVEIARRICRASEAGVPFDEMAVLLRSTERHQPLVAEALRRAGIPVAFARGTMRPDVTGRSFLALLYCAEEGLTASRFAEYLSLGQMPENTDSPAHMPTPLWERLMVDAAVIGGASRWRTRLAGLRAELHARYEREQDPDDREHLDRKIASLEALEALALPIIEKLADLPARAFWGDWIDTLTALADFTLAQPERVVALLEELEPMAEMGPVGLSEVLVVLAPRLNSLVAAPRESRYGKVWVAAVEEARGMSFRYVFVPGLNEGLFPRPPAEDPLLLKAQREALGVELRAEDTELLRIAAACASEKLTLSFSRLDLLTGRERVPSFYAFAAHRAAGGAEIDVRQFDAMARSATATRIGWPAPANPADAIDDTEFDLATLAPHAPGSGQYLKKLPGRAVDSLRARWARWHKAWKPADGLIIEEIGSDAMKPHLMTTRSWSPSALQQYARCPYRFALQGIHGLRPAERPTGIQRLDPATRGSIFHTVQYELLRDLSERGMLPVTAGNLEAALEHLDLALNETTRKAQEDLAPAIPQIWRAEVQSIRADLRGWLQQKSAMESEWTPEYFELSFGLRDPVGRDPRSSVDPVEVSEGYKLRGSIDLVERHRSGVVRVVDHKTGKLPDPKPDTIGGGEVLQPLLYALAAEKILGEEVSFGRLLYATIRQNYTPIEVQLNAITRRRAEQVLQTIDTAMRNGFLPAAPRKDACKACEYLPVCGPYEEERVAIKLQSDLQPLKDLRRVK